MPALNAYSKRFAALLFAQYPEWETQAEIDASGSLTVIVLSPNENASYPLVVSTADDEVTIDFDRYHEHFFLNEEEQDFEDALELIADLLAERVVVIIFMEGERWLASQCGPVEGPYASPEPGQRRITRSWRGNFDAEFVG